MLKSITALILLSATSAFAAPQKFVISNSGVGILGGRDRKVACKEARESAEKQTNDACASISGVLSNSEYQLNFDDSRYCAVTLNAVCTADLD